MPSERFMQQHYGASGYVKPGTRFCAQCGHSSDWHRHDDAENVPPTDPNCKFRCIGYDCEAAGPPVKNGCTCPDFIAQAGKFAQLSYFAHKSCTVPRGTHK